MITVKDEAEKFEEQAAKDWETILLARAKELAPGKIYDTCFRLVVVVAAAAVSGRKANFARSHMNRYTLEDNNLTNNRNNTLGL